MFIAMALLCSLPVSLQAVPAYAREFKQALPPYKFTFPRDHASHDEFRTEWWYFTGHLQSTDKRTFGYELTFFRTGLDNDDKEQNPWNLRNIYLAHFAVTDENGKRFFYREKLNRAGVKFAGASQSVPDVYNENWSMRAKNNEFHLKAIDPEFSIDLTLESKKPPVVHGKNGVSQKADCKGCASHYYSLTRLQTSGKMNIGKQTVDVTGLTWMDHEFGSNQLTPSQVGWDWFSVQLDNNIDLMLYVMRNNDGSTDPNSSGTIINADGSTQHLSRKDYVIQTKSTWTSDKTKGKYPSAWHVSIPAVQAELDVVPTVADQELVTKGAGVTYWEGASTVKGTYKGRPANGKAYVEMTGYAEKFSKRI